MRRFLKREIYKALFVIMALLTVSVAYAQVSERIDLKGIVLDKNGEGLAFATVSLNNGALGAICDSNGNFSVDNIKSGEYAYSVSLLGYDSKQGVIKVSEKYCYFKFTLDELTLALEDVVVTASRSDVGSSVTINEEAILHVQAKSLEDILQLLPGGLTQNPSLNNLGQVSLREVDDDDNNSLGAAVIVDGAQLSNDANLQTMSFTKNYNSVGFGDVSNEQTTANMGIDLRSISAENIESVEVIRGIPSAEYGNLTSGLVIVNTKVGATPFEAKAKVDAFSKLFYAGKGFLLGKGAINVGADYSQSYSDPRKTYLGYERFTGNLGYSTVFNADGKRPISFNVKSSFYSNINSQKDDDPQLTELQQTYRNENIGGRITVNGDIRTNSWITKVDYNLSAQIAKQDDYTTKYIYSPDQVVTASRTEGTHEAQFNDVPYWCSYSINGLPINLYGQIKANKYIQLTDKNFTNFKSGIDYKYDVNKGSGLEYDIDYPPQALGSQRLRPRAYSDIPGLNNLSWFLENNSNFAFGSTSLKTVVGIRLNSLLLNENLAGRSSIFVAEPRVNLSYYLVDNKKASVLKHLSIFGGFGISNKMPTLLSLYPEMAYFDYQNLAYKAGSDDAQLALMTTNIIEDTYNANLKPMTSTKWEIGTNFTLWGIKGSINYYNERTINEFGYSSQLDLTSYKLYSVPAGATEISYTDGEVIYVSDGVSQTATYEDKIYFETWAKPDNDSKSYKHGIEYTLDLGKFKPLRTSLYIDGAWFYTKRVNTQNYVSTFTDTSYEYAPVYYAGEGSINQRVNTNFRFITHIPKIELIITTTVQVVWCEKSRAIYEDEDGNAMYTLSDDGSYYMVAPIGFYDKQGNFYEWKSEYAYDDAYERMNSANMIYAYDEDKISPWVQLNFRLTKEFKKFGSVSIIANNFLSKSVWHTNQNTNVRSNIASPMYIGAEIKISL